MPVIVRSDRHPTPLLEVADDHRLVNVHAVRDPGAHFGQLQLKNYFFFNLVPSSEEPSFLTTFFGLYFSHRYTHITHYKSCWTFCVGSYSCTALWTLLLLRYIHIKIRIDQLLIFTEKFLPLPGFEPGTSPVRSRNATN